MGASGGVGIDAWLRQGGLVVTASERAARALSSAFHRARRSEGLTAWAAPNIQDWNRFVRGAWAAHTFDGRLLLNPTQERSIWTGIAEADVRLAALLEGPRYRLAALALDAHELLCSHAPRYLRPSSRSGWQNDAAAFSRWLTAFDEICRSGNLLSPARLPVELLGLLNDPQPGVGSSNRPPLLLAGFDRILPTQRTLFDAWGSWQMAEPNEVASRIQFHEAADDKTELAACALWCSQSIAASPGSRILVLTQDTTKRRGQIERAFLTRTGSAGAPRFEFSLGIPLNQVAIARAALLLLRWLKGPLAEHELDWLFSTGHAAANARESTALQAHMRTLRRRGMERPDWTLSAFLQPLAGPSGNHSPDRDGMPEWAARIRRTQRRLDEFSRREQTPLDWAEFIPHLLEDAAWPGDHPLSSAEFQAARRWQQALETAASLGFNGRRIGWKEFLSVLTRIVEETLFAPESIDAPIQIAGPAESAGLTADAIWFLGATEDVWPAGGSANPLLPLEVQREAHMPHAAPQLDWNLALAMTTRLLASAPEVHFSYARQIEGIESRPSRVIALSAGPPQPLPAELIQTPSPSPLTTSVEDFSLIPLRPGTVQGGASVLTFQSQCPFKAFANARLGAQSWEPAQAGLTPSQRGNLLHEVLHAVWGGPPDGIRTHRNLLELTDPEIWVAAHVQRVFESKLRPSLRDRMPQRYLELEQQRLTRLVTQWLEYESTRFPFEVLETEASRTQTIAELTLDLRLDRLDRLNDGSVLVIDYKSGDVSPRSWDLPRPDDVQLPLYAGFALDENQDLGGLVFAKIRPGSIEFAGCVGDPSATLFAGLKSGSSLMKNAYTLEQLEGWRETIEQLAKDFLAGRADVDPRDPPETCDRCGLQTLCRIHENQVVAVAEEESDSAASRDSAEADDE